ncbi:TonB-dependent receptor [Bdellovibrio sp. HCB209]|uniref:TonB-dependent receptor n=1 Tax=Bdellovibrio sp. HCB209 TaxID=3394354 RepID=UPI0039B43012
MRISIAVLFTLQACLAHAQTTPTTPETTTTETQSSTETSAAKPAETYKLQQVQILGNKEEKSYLESTESISVISGESYDKAVKTDSIKALNALPNVQMNKNDNTFSIRGINNLGVTGYQKDNLASILVDDVFQTDLAVTAGAFEFWDLDHIEIYRGAQSTTQGINSLAGNILMFHRKPTGQTEGAAKIGLGNYGQKEIGAVTNNVMADGKILTRVAVNVERNDGYIKNVTTGDDRWGRTDKNYLTADMIYKINAFDEIRWNVKVMQTENGGNFTSGTDPFAYEVSEDVNTRFLTNNQQSSLRYFKKINEQSSNETILAYSQSQQDVEMDADRQATNVAGKRMEDHSDNYTSLENLYRYQTEKIKNVLGLHVHNYMVKDNYDFNVIISGNLYKIGQYTTKYQQTGAIFDSLLYKFNETHAMNLGLRYEYVKNKFDTTVNTNAPFPYNASAGSYTSTEEGGMFLPKVGYILTNDNQSYGISFTQGYRTGGVSINRTKATASDYGPEKTDNAELSYKMTGDEVRLSANAFYTRWNNQQVQVNLSAGGNDPYDTQIVNAASSTLYGGEVEAQYKLSPKNFLQAGLGYNQTRFDEFKGPTGTDYSGNEFPFASHFTGSITYTFKPTDLWAWDTTGRYMSPSYGNAENSKKAPEQWYVDTSLQYLMAQWNISTEVFVRNVFDKQYMLFDATSTIAGYTTKYYQVNTPREFGARLTYFW